MQSPSKNVHVQLTTKIQQADMSETFTFSEPGQLIQKDQITYLRYTEHAEIETPIIIKFNPDQTVRLSRQGTSQVHLDLNPKQTTTTTYITPVGHLPLMVKTLHLTSDLLNGTLITQYQLYQNDQLVGDYHLKLTFD
ncbi:DUF1934 domain-containing protein [Weissella diestrammenae]|uniref:DUF1934 domain-containing protein n=1 Tax=Weissella diestrammenae TaxID=1162633 RepID=A0A7G9T6M6_9LACO|nr:DUF1934 domain-containing protein [Weissella diestrammenae]MCM0582965.1 DUF1934 domain-containing protein [Weissella diestrammenae]QNN75751.1 DUF1934 domain-containing protein [Weissella diestrammenae]